MSECLVEFGWLPTAPSIDLGEDFIVHIYFDGRATGVTFHVQEKSITNLEQRRKGDSLVYQLKVSDLEHWENFSLPVVLIVWDITKREGRWALIRDLILGLERTRPNWRSQSKVRISIPWHHATNDIGLNKLKWVIGQQIYPLIARGKDFRMQMSLAFPDTEEGQASRQAFERHIKEGEPVILKGHIIQAIEFPDWWKPWFGGYDPEAIEINFGKTSSSHMLVVSMTAISSNGGVASLSGIELKAIQVGTEQTRFSNDHQASTLNVRLLTKHLDNRVQGSVSFSLRNMGSNVQDTLNTFRFLKLIAQGCVLKLDILNQNSDPVIIPIETQIEFAPDAKFFELVNRLAIIQEKTRVFFRVPEGGISYRDGAAIDKLFEIITRGRVRLIDKVLPLDVKGDFLALVLDAHRKGEPVNFFVTTDDNFVEIFETKIPIGPMTSEVTGYTQISDSEIEAAIQNSDSENYFPIKIVKAEVIEVFSNYPNTNGV